MNRTAFIKEFRQLINQQLPSVYTQPVRFNHCFNRIILDWIFKDCWYHHLNKNKTALSQLYDEQLKIAIERMKAWLQNQELLIDDHNASLKYRQPHKISNASSALFLN